MSLLKRLKYLFFNFLIFVVIVVTSSLLLEIFYFVSSRQYRATKIYPANEIISRATNETSSAIGLDESESSSFSFYYYIRITPPIIFRFFEHELESYWFRAGLKVKYKNLYIYCVKS